MKAKFKKNLIFYSIIITIIFIGYGLIIKTFEQNIIFFITPKEINLSKHTSKVLRIGGLVKEGSVFSNSEQQHIFIITDMEGEILVKYKGILPNLFRDKQGVIVKGKIVENYFLASELLAKHDEKYIPKELTDKLKDSDVWRGK
jgi:cytochrome c-type biogenesis protein CcmE